MADTMKAFFLLLFVFEGVICGFIPPDVESGYNGNDPNLAAIYQRLAALEDTVSNLQYKNKKLEEENVEIRRILSSGCGCKNETTTTKSQEIVHDKQTIRASENYLNGVTTIKKRLLTGGTTNRVVVFRASLSKSLSSLGDHQALDYDNVKLNIGNAYDARHGHLVAPVKGIYLVITSAFADPGKRVILDVVHNGNLITVLDTGLHNTYSSQSKTLPVLLEKGDMIWIRTRPGFEGEQVPVYAGAFHNYFAAVLLAEL